MFTSIDLGHAAADADDHVGALLLELVEFAELGEDLMFGLLPHGAGIEEGDAGLRGALGGG